MPVYVDPCPGFCQLFPEITLYCPSGTTLSWPGLGVTLDEPLWVL